MIDDVIDRIEGFLNREVDLVVNGTDVFGSLSCGNEIGGTLQSDGKGVETRPPCGL